MTGSRGVQNLVDLTSELAVHSDTGDHGRTAGEVPSRSEEVAATGLGGDAHDVGVSDQVLEVRQSPRVPSITRVLNFTFSFLLICANYYLLS